MKFQRSVCDIYTHWNLTIIFKSIRYKIKKFYKVKIKYEIKKYTKFYIIGKATEYKDSNDPRVQGNSPFVMDKSLYHEKDHFARCIVIW